MKVALMVSNPYRDLPAQVLTAVELCQRGVTCYIVPGPLRNREVWPLAPDLVVLDNMRVGNERLTARMVQTGMRVVVVDAEGAVFESLERYTDKLARDPAVRHAVDRFCAWGPAMASHVTAAGWFTQEQVNITGTPRMDFYVRPWRDAALELSRFAEDFTRPLVLINGSFKISNPFAGTAEAVTRQYLQHGYRRDETDRWIEIERETMQEFLGMARRLAQAFPDVSLVYRPHPFEELATYRGQFDGLSNLHLIKKGAVEGWILRANAIIHLGSSTAIEAGVAGIPAFTPSWIAAPVSYPTVDAVSIHCASEDELIQGLRRSLDAICKAPPQSPGRLNEVLARWFSIVDGCAHRRIADAVMQCLERPGPRVSLDKCRKAAHNIDSPQATWRERSRAGMQRLLGLSPYWSFRRRCEVAPDLSWDRSGRCFGVPEVEAVVRALEPVAAQVHGNAWRPVRVDYTQRRGEYHFRYRYGRAVSLWASNPLS